MVHVRPEGQGQVTLSDPHMITRTIPQIFDTEAAPSVTEEPREAQVRVSAEPLSGARYPLGISREATRTRTTLLCLDRLVGDFLDPQRHDGSQRKEH